VPASRSASPYVDLGRPPLRESALRRAFELTPGLWRDIRVVEETGSTNADVLAAATAGAPEGLVLVAERQTAGRGRLDRSWVAPARSALTFSVLLRPAGVPASNRGWLPLLAGIAVADVLRRVAEVDAYLKWPNDVLIGDRKVAGLLAEAVPGRGSDLASAHGTGDAVVVGIGVNVSMRPPELPSPTATSLAIEGAATTDRDPLLRAILREFSRRYVAWREGGGGAGAGGVRAAYAERCLTLGRKVSVALPGGLRLEGEAIAVDLLGRLVIRTDDGDRSVGAGDVIHVRSSGSS
jgi:BirA family transcriptional regulator, biotin operon repressor / biotin---[acetyl-CoA-carboxylase] ligase